MRVFVTGASGFIGSAVVPELIGAGHEVVGLARSDESAAIIEAAGAKVRRGDLDDLDGLGQGAAESDGVIHLAFRHDLAFTGDYDGAAQADLQAIEAMGTVLEGSDRALVIASGTAGLPQGVVATEHDQPDPNHPMRGRALNSDRVLAMAADGVRSSSVRLAPTVHDAGDQGFIPTVVGVARAKGVSAYIGEGANRWTAVHRLDAARLFRLAVERARGGTVLHGVGEEGVSIRSIAELIGRRLDVPVVSITPETAVDHFGFLGMLLAADLPASSAITQELLGWAPSGPGLLDDMDANYFG